MSDVTRILSASDEGDPRAAEEILPTVYAELRRLAARHLAREGPGQTLQATALVHEAYLKLVGADGPPAWSGRAHFFAAAAEAMRRILIDRARRKRRLRHGGGRRRRALDDDLPADAPDERLLALDEALRRLEAEDPTKARLVTLRYFAGLTVEEAGAALGLSRATAQRHWSYARAWLYHEVAGRDDSSPG
jgi:RNA polymerase sigma factor (TIGR02999 family)